MGAARAAALAALLALSSSAPGGLALLLTPPGGRDLQLSPYLRSIWNASGSRSGLTGLRELVKPPTPPSSHWPQRLAREYFQHPTPPPGSGWDRWMNAPGISLVYQDLRKRRSEPQWQFKRADFLRLAEEVGHNLAFERSCPQAHAWIGSLEFLVVPRLKLAFCYQAKAACTDFKDLMNELNGLHLGTGFGNLNYGDSGYSRFRLNPQDVKKENGWKFATFTRDPLERYLAVYGSTCMPQSLPNSSGQFYEHRQECCGEEVPMGKIDWEQVMSSFEQRALSDARSGLPVEEQHWSPQVELLHNCGWGKFRPENLDYRGDVSSGNVSEQVKEMLRTVRATADDMKVAEKFFPSNRIAGHKSPIKPDYRSFYRRREVVDAVKDLYAADYHLIPGIGRGFTDKVEAHL